LKSADGLTVADGFVWYRNVQQFPELKGVPYPTWLIASSAEALAEANKWLLAEPLSYLKGNK
jgi:hypothetical protein